MSNHSKLSPSSASRWIQCPGSVRLSAMVELEVGTESIYAREGTMAHKIAEIEAAYHFGIDSKSKHAERALHWRDTTPEEMHEEMLVHAAAYVDLLQSFVDEYENPKVYLEQWVDPRIPGSGGTADAIIVCEAAIHAVDYKYGRGVAVFAQDNPQLKIYSLGALEDFDLLGTVETICMTVHQPRINNVSHECMDVADLRAWRDEIALPAAKLALSGEGYLSPSESACRFCPVAGQCKVRADYAAKRDFGHPELLSPDELAEALNVIPDIEDWCKKVKEAALRKAYYDNVRLPGWKVVRSGGRRRITDEDFAAAALKEHGFPEDVTCRVTVKPLGELERLVGGRKILDEILKGIIDKPEGKESLVPDSDTRSGITVTGAAIEDFS